LRVNLNVIGKSGATTVVASFRTDDNDANRSGASNLHQFYITTKVGPDAIVAATAATINFFIIYSVSCEKKTSAKLQRWC
jgi:hypothetical protein